MKKLNSLDKFINLLEKDKRYYMKYPSTFNLDCYDEQFCRRMLNVVFGTIKETNEEYSIKIYTVYSKERDIHSYFYEGINEISDFIFENIFEEENSRNLQAFRIDLYHYDLSKENVEESTYVGTWIFYNN